MNFYNADSFQTTFCQLLANKRNVVNEAFYNGSTHNRATFCPTHVPSTGSFAAKVMQVIGHE
jgi:hypothetical protein